jgi:hypothetical protein
MECLPVGLQGDWFTLLFSGILDRSSKGNWRLCFSQELGEVFKRQLACVSLRNLNWGFCRAIGSFCFLKGLEQGFTDMVFRCFSKDLERLSSDDWLCFPILKGFNGLAVLFEGS